jgi:hypothetical protein
VVAVILAVAAVVGLAASVVNTEGVLGVSMALRVLALIAAVVLPKYALGTTAGALKAATVEGTPVPPATRGALFTNLKSGGGKAERFHLVDECKRRRIEPIVLHRTRIGCSGSVTSPPAVSMCSAWRAATAPRRWVARSPRRSDCRWWVVPAGTRNHLALDLGLDRDDVVGALDAYGDAVERTLDLADVNGHVFVNNVSLGLCAAIVRSPEYRDAKVDTTLATLP